jgi:hypothetical protein
VRRQDAILDLRECHFIGDVIFYVDYVCVCCTCALPSTIAALWYLEVGGASGCLTALQWKTEEH